MAVLWYEGLCCTIVSSGLAMQITFWYIRALDTSSPSVLQLHRQRRMQQTTQPGKTSYTGVLFAHLYAALQSLICLQAGCRAS